MKSSIRRLRYSVICCLLFTAHQCLAGDSTYLEIRKVGITDTFLIKALGKYTDSLKRSHIHEGKWYLSVFIRDHFDGSDTTALITVGCVDYPLNIDEPDRKFPAYYAVFNGIPVLFQSSGHLSVFDLSQTTCYSEASKKELIEVLKPFLPPPQLNYEVHDKNGRLLKTYDEYWVDKPIMLGVIGLTVVIRKNHIYSMSIQRSY